MKQVTALLSKNDGKSSFYITQKRFTYNSEASLDSEDTLSDLPKGIKPITCQAESDMKQYPILIRVTDGNKNKMQKVKLNTVVEPLDLDAFWTEYINILKSGMKGLKKKSKSKKKSKKSSKTSK